MLTESFEIKRKRGESSYRVCAAGCENKHLCAADCSLSLAGTQSAQPPQSGLLLGGAIYKHNRYKQNQSLVENTWEFWNYFNLSFARLFFLILLFLGKSYPRSSKSTFYRTKLLFKCVIFSRRGLRFAVKTLQKNTIKTP